MSMLVASRLADDVGALLNPEGYMERKVSVRLR